MSDSDDFIRSAHAARAEARARLEQLEQEGARRFRDDPGFHARGTLLANIIMEYVPEAKDYDHDVIRAAVLGLMADEEERRRISDMQMAAIRAMIENDTIGQVQYQSDDGVDIIAADQVNKVIRDGRIHGVSFVDPAYTVWPETRIEEDHGNKSE